jgi:alpha-L-fucosidase
MLTEDYERTARQFEPGRWDAETVAKLVLDMGMQSVIITAKHYDGFCMFATKTTPFNILDFTSYDKDIINEMAKACKTYNLNLAISFSLTDWHLPAAFPMAGHHASPVSEAHHQINLQQVSELLTQYGPISRILFHSGANTPEQSRELRQLVKSLQPECLVSNGIGNNYGDFIMPTPQQWSNQHFNTPWLASCNLHPESRGYHISTTNNNTVEKAREKINEMVDVISSGGNYSLSLGPKGNGSLKGSDEEVLRHMGRWIKVNRKAIIDTKGNPFFTKSQFWRCTHKHNKLYIFVDSVPGDKKIKLNGLRNKITDARYLGSGIEPEFTNNHATPEIIWTSPAMADPMQIPVIEVELNDTLTIAPENVLQINQQDTLLLNIKKSSQQTSISGGDHFISIVSVTGIKWDLNSTGKLNAELKFTAYEQGRNIVFETSINNKTLNLKGKQAGLIKTKGDTIHTFEIFRSGEYFGPMQELHLNPNGENRLQIGRSAWMAMNTNRKQEPTPLPMSARYYYIEIISENSQQFCYEIRANDGLQVWLNQEMIHLARNTYNNDHIKKLLVLNLKQGRNILLIKNYNRLGTTDKFKLTPMPDAQWYTQSVPVPDNLKTIGITLPKSYNSHVDIDLPNLSIILTAKN